MKTTIELPDELLVAAKKRAAEQKTTLRALFEQGLRRQLARPRPPRPKKAKRRVRLITVDGGLPPELDLRDRAAMHEWLRRNR